MIELFSICLLGLGIWGMQRFGAGVCLGYDVDRNYIDEDPEHSNENPCFAPQPVRMIVWWVQSTVWSIWPSPPHPLCGYECYVYDEDGREGGVVLADGCSLKYNGIHILNRNTASDLCRDGDESTPIEYFSSLGYPSSACDAYASYVNVHHIAKATASGKPRIYGFFSFSAGTAVAGPKKFKDLETRIHCGSRSGENHVLDQIELTGFSCCDFSAAEYVVDFSGVSI